MIQHISNKVSKILLMVFAISILFSGSKALAQESTKQIMPSSTEGFSQKLIIKTADFQP